MDRVIKKSKIGGNWEFDRTDDSEEVIDTKKRLNKVKGVKESLDNLEEGE